MHRVIFASALTGHLQIDTLVIIVHKPVLEHPLNLFRPKSWLYLVIWMWILIRQLLEDTSHYQLTLIVCDLLVLPA